MSRISAGGFNADAGLAEREMSMGDDFGLSEVSSIRWLSNRIGKEGMVKSSSLDGDELSVVILSLSRKPPPMSSPLLSQSPSDDRSLPLRDLGDGSVKVLASGELTRWSSPNHRLCVGRRTRFGSGVASSLDCIDSSKPEFDDELDDRAKSDRDVDRDGRGGVEVLTMVGSLDDGGTVMV